MVAFEFGDTAEKLLLFLADQPKDCFGEENIDMMVMFDGTACHLEIRRYEFHFRRKWV